MYDFPTAMSKLKAEGRTLGTAFLALAQKKPDAIAIEELSRDIDRARLAAGALSLLPFLKLGPKERNVGVLMPPGIGGSIVNIALALDGRTSVNLNHTAGDAQVHRMCELADIKTVITAQAYLDKIGEIKLPVTTVKVDELLPKIGALRKLINYLRVKTGLTFGINKARPHDVATILFSSGTTGDPKGVQLTHAQILANIDGVLSGLGIQDDVGHHCLMSALPLFHSFGLVNGTWCGLAAGLKIAAHPNPREPESLGKLAQKSGATYMLSTPTFARMYMKKVPPEHFASLEFAIVGAEKCPKELAEAFYTKYNTRLLEGYGCTELAPTVSFNTPDKFKLGSVGRPMPGIEVILVDPDSQAILPNSAEGLIVVRSPARMLGYLNRPDLTEAAFVHQGYNTGDIGRLDEDGFLYITGRLARFAKIGGEMVPLDKVENLLQDYLTKKYGEEFQIAVAAVADAHKGEKLVALHTGLPCDEEELLDSLNDLPNIFQPKKREFYKVHEIPVLGTGKRNLKEVKTLAERVSMRVTG